ncbi:hypothetical protein EM308_13420 [Flavobacterium gilvum]|uniref:Uncharacterized protein n=1 Tax=Flavobacterium gilvum TaxID=1492737 RepID=A0AAC9N4B0_9FLAO|nr:hypothetical protein EM308_13420 [Flavobacterium gilvum]KFC59049.1 hypothetical protein FEM08_21810 [Flavobacterium gilvum]
MGDNLDRLDNFDFIYNHVKNLRKKLLKNKCEDYLQTIYGIGYISGFQKHRGNRFTVLLKI